MTSLSTSSPGHDVQSVSRLTGIEPGHVRFLEAEFGRYLGPAGTPRTSFGPDDVDLLRVVHERVFVEGQDVQTVHRDLAREQAPVSSVHVIAVTSGKGGVGKPRWPSTSRCPWSGRDCAPC